MGHKEQYSFCCSVKKKFPHYFNGTLVLDAGSLEINSSNRPLFNGSLYLGLDLAAGKNVDITCPAHELNLPDETFDVIISTEMLEHDMHYEKSLQNFLRLLKPGGLLLLTCATTNRPEHGTARTRPEDAPFLMGDAAWSNYYKNLTENDVRCAIPIETCFQDFFFDINKSSHDLYFWGIKNGVFTKRTDYSFCLSDNNAAIKHDSLKQLVRLQQKKINDLHKKLGGFVNKTKAKKNRSLLRRARSGLAFIKKNKKMIMSPAPSWEKICTKQEDVPHTLLSDFYANPSYLNPTTNPVDDFDFNWCSRYTNHQPLAVIVHAYYPEIFEKIIEKIKKLPIKSTLYVSFNRENKEAIHKKLAASGLPFHTMEVDNCGRDILPFLKIIHRVIENHHRVFIKLHTKKSPHLCDGEAWLNTILEELLAPKITKHAVQMLDTSPVIGMITPKSCHYPMHVQLNPNKKRLFPLADKMGVSRHELLTQHYSAGSMFYAHIDSIRPLLNLGLQQSDFEPEHGQLDGSLAHVLERCFAISTYATNKQVVGTDFFDSVFCSNAEILCD